MIAQDLFVWKRVGSVGYRVNKSNYLFFYKFLVCYDLKIYVNKLTCIPNSVAQRADIAHLFANKSRAKLSYIGSSDFMKEEKRLRENRFVSNSLLSYVPVYTEQFSPNLFS